MADKVVAIQFDIKTSEAVDEINKVINATEEATQATTEYKEELKDTKKTTETAAKANKEFEEQLKGMADATKAAQKAIKTFDEQLTDIKSSIDGAGFKDLSRALKQYQDLALKAGENSPIGKQALTEAGELKDRLLDLKAAIKTTGQDGRALQASLQLGGGIVAGFGAVQGVMALVGSESEDLQKTLVKLQAVQATLASVEEIRSVLEKESALRITAVTVAEKLRTAATLTATFVTNGASLALKVFRGALVATGIGAVVFLLYEAAKAMGVFGDSTNETNKKLAEQKERQEALNKQVDEQIKKTTELRNARQGGLTDLKNELEILKAQGATKTELFIAEKNIIDQQLSNLKVAQQIRGKLNAEELEQQRQLQVDKHILNLNYIRETKEANEEARKQEAERLKKAADERRAKEKEWQSELKEDREKLAEDEKKAAEKKLLDDQQLMIARTELFAADLQAQKDSADSKKALEKEVLDTKVDLATKGFEIINQLAALSGDKSKAAAKRAFEINKAFQIAQATMEGYRAVLKTYAETPGGIVLKSIAAGIAGSFAAIQIAKISQSKFDSSKFDKGNTSLPGGGLSASAPTQTTAPQTPGRVSNITGNQTTTVKAIVVESDITTTQKRINSIQELAKI
jgi:hypothetical protein